ncbi:DUF2254 domain-containing protein [Cellulomonas sp. S1-8]|uniref:DUF2254 domain-containing protein n=1 Tax=Cellulomonas sp. S1-8 TaxID=2904790 RepID=UPI00224469DD|nr:DUF2254 domain-containing protein [Cellulomonas sp. S1-8]UZN02036.1 DUF2254 domain-containing protein [Cellulomonas sp. S1-8]
MNTLQRLGMRFWFIPALMCTAAFVLAHGLIALDRSHAGAVAPGWTSLVLYRVGASGSRDILGAIASSSLAVAGTTFSITMAVLALTSSSYGPRLVRNFMTDRGNQVVLGVYVSTFLYSLLVLRSIRVLGDPGDLGGDVFVPHLAVNAAVVLAVGNVAVLIYFIHHISDSIQISTLARRVRTDLLDSIDRLYPAEVGHDPSHEQAGPTGDVRAGTLDGPGAPVTAGRSGYLQSVRDGALMKAAIHADVVLDLRLRPGQFVLEDTVTVTVHPAGRADDRLTATIRSALQVADTRSPHQDPEFSVQQLTEMAVRALSPGTNDPYTAVNALDDLSVALSRLAGRTMPSAARVDDGGTVRVVAPPVDVDELVASVLDSIRWYATGHPSVMTATLTLVRRVGAHTHSASLRRVLALHVDLLQQAVTSGTQQPADKKRFAALADTVRDELAAVVPPPG